MDNKISRLVKKAVFPVGGIGTRFLPITQSVPKEMLPIVDKPLIEYAVSEALESGIEEFIFVTRKGKTSIEDHFEKYIENIYLKENNKKIDDKNPGSKLSLSKLSFSYTRQIEPLGLGHAVWCARDLVGNDPFAVLLADELFVSSIPCLKQLLNVYEKNQGCIIGLGEVPFEQTSRYGVVSYSEENGNVFKLNGMVEKPEPKHAPSNLSIIGRYILQPEIFNLLEGQKSTIGGEIQLTDSMLELLKHINFHGVKFEGERFDCGSKAGFIKANVALGLMRTELNEELINYLKSPSLIK